MPNVTNILVTFLSGLDMTDSQKKILEQAAPGAQFTYCFQDDVTLEMVAGAQIWIGNPSLRHLAQAQALRFVQLITAGADYYFSKPGIAPAHIPFACSSGAFGLSISEYMTGGLLMLMRRMHIYRDQQRDQIWYRNGKAHTIYGSIILVVGMGDLGGEFARRVKGLGAYVIGIRRTESICPDYIDEQHLIGSIGALLPRSDVVALCLPATAQTAGLMNAERLSLMKHGSYLINVGRGSAVDGYALCNELQSGRIAGALIDVTDPEPLPPDHPLWCEQNALITPHVSGNYDVPFTVDRVVEIAAENLRRYISDRPLINSIDPETGYRSV